MLQSSGPLGLDDAVLAIPGSFFGGGLEAQGRPASPSHLPSKVSPCKLRGLGCFGAGSCVGDCNSCVRWFMCVLFVCVSAHDISMMVCCVHCIYSILRLSTKKNKTSNNRKHYNFRLQE